jgi:hypothetical protein
MLRALCVVFILVLTSSLRAQQKSIYESQRFLDRYEKRIEAPPIDLQQDLSKLSLEELRYLRNALFARKGYVFKDAAIRAYFQGKDWYQPIWWEPTFKVTLDSAESAFAARIQSAERLLLRQNFIDGNARANIRNLVNLGQFDSIPTALLDKLDHNGFALVPDEHVQLFDLYEENDYNLVPNFVTTDLYLQLLHMHFDFLLRTIEERHFRGALTRMLTTLHASALEDLRHPAASVRGAAAFTAAYCAVPLRILQPKKKITVPPEYASMVKEELTRISRSSETGSRMLRAPLFNYTQFIPRGHYTRSDALKRYFQAMMWLQIAPLFVNDETGIGVVAYLASALLTPRPAGKPAIEEFRGMAEPISWFVGDPDNLSIAQAVACLTSSEKQISREQLFERSSIDALRNYLFAHDPERIVARAGSPEAAEALAKKRLYFFPQRYTPDAEIMQRLVHVLRDPEPKRPFPKGLDVFAAFGNATAKDILLNEYHETQRWPAYADSLTRLTSEFSRFSAWDQNTYNAWMRSLFSLSQPGDSAQPFMRTRAWQKKCLGTALASWTELKHDVVLYAKQPMAAECGGDDQPPPPVTVGYVEPNTRFWEHAIRLVTMTRDVLDRFALTNGDIKTKTAGLLEMGEFLLAMSRKELRKERLTDKEYETIRLIGVTASLLTLSIIEAPDWESVDGPDRSVALATDVYTYNQSCLQEAVGRVNSIYAVVEIDGLLYLTRGAAFSYYEFVQPAANRLTDEAWQKMLEEGGAPGIPMWLEEIYAPVKPLEMAPGSSYSSGC